MGAAPLGRRLPPIKTIPVSPPQSIVHPIIDMASLQLLRSRHQHSVTAPHQSRKRRLSLQALETRRLLVGALAIPLATDADDSVAAEVGHLTAAHGEQHLMAAHGEHTVVDGVHITDAYVTTHHDKVPRFANLGDSLVNIRSGNWSDPNIWPGGVVPGEDARVQIAPMTTVVYDVDSDVRYDAIEVQGQLSFATDIDTKMIIDVLMVMPQGTLTIGTAEDPARPDVTSEIIFRGDTALKTGTVANPGLDPSQYGKGLLAFGKVTMHGQEKDLTFIRLGADAKAGDTVLTLDQAPDDWRVGDRLVVPDTRQIERTSKKPVFTSQAEEVVITAIRGNQVTISQALAYDHAGPRDAQGNVGAVEQSMLPHIGNLTRNVVLRSETPDEVSRRGHTMFFHRADLNLRYAAFEGLGRTSASIRPAVNNSTFDEDGKLTRIGTNQIGRYTIHLHHVWGADNPDNVGYQGQIVGSVINDFMKWGVAVHNTHYFLLQSNVAYYGRGDSVNVYNGAGGAAFATEDGNESYNEFDGNFVVHTKAGESQRIMGSPGEGGFYNRHEVSRDGFWFRGLHNYVTNNVVANAPDFAYNYNGDGIASVLKVPKFRGADMTNPDHIEEWNPIARKDDNKEIIGTREGLPVLKSSGNEAYGATGQGLWISRPQGSSSPKYYSSEISHYEDFRIWHVTDAGVYHWGQDNRSHFSGFVLRNDPAVSALSTDFYNTGLSFGDKYYAIGNLEVRDFDIQGFNIGIQLPHRPYDYDSRTPDVALFENGSLVNHINIEDRYARWSVTKENVIRNVAFDLVHAPAAGSTPENALNIWMHPDNRDPHTEETKPSRLLIFDFNQQPGNNFELFFEEQAPNAIVQPYRVSRGGTNPEAPGVGMTVQEAWDQFGIAPAGAVAPSQQIDGDNGAAALARAAKLDIQGLLFPFDGEPPQVQQPPPAPGAKTPGVKLPEVVGWNFDDDGGTTVRDFSGNEHHGEMLGDFNWVDGKQGSALEFDGQVGVVDVGNIGHSNQLTVSAWVKRGTGGGGTIVSKTQGAHEWELQYGSNGYAYFVINGVNTGKYLGPGTGEWTHLVGTYDKTAIRLYQDGVLVNSKAYTEDVKDLGNSVGIGRRVNGNGASFGGQIDDVRIYNRALSEAEVAELTAQSSAIPAPLAFFPQSATDGSGGSTAKQVEARDESAAAAEFMSAAVQRTVVAPTLASGWDTLSHETALLDLIEETDEAAPLSSGDTLRWDVGLAPTIDGIIASLEIDQR